MELCLLAVEHLAESRSETQDSNRLTRRLDETNLNRGKDMSVGIIGCDGLMKGLCEWPSGDKDSFVGELPRIVHSTVGFKMSTNNRELSSSTVDQQ